jgi:DNA-binding FadR family transcriptional regulator
MQEETDTLPVEAELCRTLSVSRTVLREAIKMLSAKGMLEVSPKRGTKVQPRSKWNLLDPHVLVWQAASHVDDDDFVRSLCEIRKFLEPAAAELAAERASDVEVAELYGHWKDMETSVQITDRFIAADMKFHGVIFSACRNDLLNHMMTAIGGALRASRTITTRLPGSSTASLPLHRNVAAAIHDRDPAAARSAMLLVVTLAARDIYQVRLSRLEER